MEKYTGIFIYLFIAKILISHMYLTEKKNSLVAFYAGPDSSALNSFSRNTNSTSVSNRIYIAAEMLLQCQLCFPFKAP